jgi:phosphopantetheinyl transferase
MVIDRSPLDRANAALRVWSAKEASAKALGIGLADAWARLRVTDVAETTSQLKNQNGKHLTAIHTTIDGHLFTLLALENRP